MFRVFVGAHAWLCSHNFLFDLGIKKAFEGENENMLRQRRYADIVFSNSKETRKARGLRLWPVLQFIIGLVVVVALALVNYEEMETSLAVPTAAALGLTIVTYMLALATRHTVFRVIPCLNAGGNPIILKLSPLLQFANILVLVFIYFLASSKIYK